MSVPQEPPPPETVVLVRQRYVDGDLVDHIRSETGLSRRDVYDCLDGVFPDSDGERPPKIPRRQVNAPRPRKAAGGRSALIASLWRTTERQVRDIDKRLRRHKQEPAERERDARMMAVVVKTVRELTAIEEKTQRVDDANVPPATIDAFRRELARKLAALGAGKGAAAADDADGA